MKDLIQFSYLNYNNLCLLKLIFQFCLSFAVNYCLNRLHLCSHRFFRLILGSNEAQNKLKALKFKVWNRLSAHLKLGLFLSVFKKIS